MSDKRNYFRVHDEVILDYRVVDADTCENSEPSLLFEDNGLLQLFSKMQEIDKEGQLLLHALSDNNRQLTDYLKLLNKKLDLISQQFVAQTVSQQQSQTRSINLSEGGISFNADKAIYKDTYLALRIIFLPAYTGITCFAKVIRSESLDQTTRLAAKFIHLPEATDKLLARQIMDIQRLARRSANDD